MTSRRTRALVAWTAFAVFLVAHMADKIAAGFTACASGEIRCPLVEARR